MTLPDERLRAILHTRGWLMDLLDPRKQPKVPLRVRLEAGYCLRHYPTAWELGRNEVVRNLHGK